MKISFDLHGVLDDMPETMKFIMESVVKNGGEVHIITMKMRSISTLSLNRSGNIKCQKIVRR